MWETFRSLRKAINHVNSQVILAIAWNSASAKNLETVLYFFDFQEIGESSRNTQKPMVDRLVPGHIAQFESEKAFNLSEEEEALSWIGDKAKKNMLFPDVPLMYCSIL